MWRTETPAPEMAPAGGRGGQSEGGTRVAFSPGKAGRFAGRLAAYGVVTVGVTMLLLRPGTARRRAGRAGGSIFFGTGLIVAVVKAMLGSPAAPQVKVASSFPQRQPPAAVSPPGSKRGAAAAPAPRPRAGGNAVAVAKPTVELPSSEAPVIAIVKTRPPVPDARGKNPSGVAAAGGAGVPAASPAPAAPASAAATKLLEIAAAAAPQVLPPVPTDLGPDCVHKPGGFALRFPIGWTRQPANTRGNWLLEAGDGKSSSIAVGLVSDAAQASVNRQNLDVLTKGFKAQPDTAVLASGFGTLAGRRCMWHRLSMRDPGGGPGGAGRCSAIHYLAPLGDGRVLKVRVAARQEKFADFAPRMKRSIDTLRLLEPQASAR